MSEPLSIKDLRSELRLTLAEFGERIGLSSKGQVSIIERENRCGLRVALAIEALSGGRVDAADLSDEVRLVRVAGHSRMANSVGVAPSSNSEQKNIGCAA